MYKLSQTVHKLKQTGLNTQITLPEFTTPEEEVLTRKMSDILFKQSTKSTVKEKAQKALQQAIKLYEKNNYNGALNALKDAATLYPDHLGIKFNLLQVYLSNFERNKDDRSHLVEAKMLLAELTKSINNNEEISRLKKCKKNTSDLLVFNHSERIWWREVDSNHRRRSRQIYSLIPLATREPLHGAIFINIH